MHFSPLLSSSLRSLSALSLLSLRPHNSRRRRDVFGVANETLARDLGQNKTTSESNVSKPEHVEQVYPFSEATSQTEFMEIFNLQPFTVYRIDIHACNSEVQRCSAAAFVFSRTKPAGGAIQSVGITPGHIVVLKEDTLTVGTGRKLQALDFKATDLVFFFFFTANHTLMPVSQWC